ncbi:MAG: hypothetical protein AAF671_07940 [Pseudomonadota bacterium]
MTSRIVGIDARIDFSHDVFEDSRETQGRISPCNAKQILNVRYAATVPYNDFGGSFFDVELWEPSPSRRSVKAGW